MLIPFFTRQWIKSALSEGRDNEQHKRKRFQVANARPLFICHASSMRELTFANVAGARRVIGTSRTRETHDAKFGLINFHRDGRGAMWFAALRRNSTKILMRFFFLQNLIFPNIPAKCIRIIQDWLNSTWVQARELGSGYVRYPNFSPYYRFSEVQNVE